MKIAVVGTGYVGLVSATCLAESGNEIVGIDKDAAKIATLEAGKLPIYEPGLLELVQRNRREQRLSFTTDLAGAVGAARLVFIAVGTPPAADGGADLGNLWAVGEALAPHLRPDAVVIIKSTVPVGTNRQLMTRMAARAGRPIEVASNPEFLKEGAAVDDFMKPDRVVVGVRRAEVGALLHELYSPFLRTERPFLIMSPESAEMTKYVANAMLATKISFINEMANLCERVGADINDVRRGIGHDERIGFQFLFPGGGYGGSCFPKDVSALIHLAHGFDQPVHLIEAVDKVNTLQKHVLPRKIKTHYGTALKDKCLAVWGLAFKPKTDDIREAPALTLIDALLAEGVRLRVHDPEAIANVRRLYGDQLVYCDRPYGALEGADGLAIMTEWPEFRRPDFEVMRRLLQEPVIFDGRNLYEPKTVTGHGFTYYAIGRVTTEQARINMQHDILAEYAAVAFDLDGTLIDSYPAITASVNFVRAQHGLPPLAVEEVKEQVGRGPDYLLAHTVPGYQPSTDIATYRRHHPSVMFEQTALLPGAAETLAGLHAAGKRLALCSNKPRAFSAQLLQHFGVAELFEIVLGPEDVARPKPAPDMVRTAVARLELPATRVLYVGDMTVDIQTARAAGVSVWVVPTGSDQRATLEAASPDRLLERLTELLTAP